MTVFWGLMIPLAGTTLGSACVFFLKDKLNELLQKGLLGFASGVMVAASVWSLLIPSMDMAAGMGRLAFVPAATGMLLGMAFLLVMDRVIPHLHLGTQEAEGPKTSLKKTTMLVLAVTLHNIPEGMAVGVVFAGMLSGSTGITVAGAFSLAIGIAIQNFPEGAIISMPLKSEGQMSRKKAFLYGTLSGAVEPVGAALTIAAFFIGHFMESGVWEIPANGLSPDGTTMAFLTMSMAEIFHSLNMRSQRGSLFTMGSRNWALLVSSFAALLLTTLVCEVPFIAAAFDFTSVEFNEYIIAIGMGFLVIPIVEIVKFFQRLAAKKKAGQN